MHPIGLTTGEAGCFMSHYSIWLYMHEHNIPYAVILEDDFEIVNPPAFKQAVREVVDEACNSGTWDLLYLSRYPVSFDIQRLSKSLCIPGFSYWTVAYILTLNGKRRKGSEEHVNTRKIGYFSKIFSSAKKNTIHFIS